MKTLKKIIVAAIWVALVYLGISLYLSYNEVQTVTLGIKWFLFLFMAFAAPLITEIILKDK
jgi:hypothetical protein